MSLLSVVDGEQRPVTGRRHRGRELQGDPVQLLRALSGLQDGHDHLAPPPVRLGLGDPAHALAEDPERPPDDRRAESVLVLELDERHHIHLVLTHPIARLGGHISQRLTDDREQIDGHPGARTQFLEGGVGQGGPAVVGVRVHEVRGQGS